MRASRGWDGDRLASDPQLAAFARAVRARYEELPAEDIERKHLLLVANEAVRRSAQRPAVTGRFRALRVATLAAATLLAMSALAAGLSYAGVVTLPDPARDVFGRVGIRLPAPAPEPAPPAPSRARGSQGRTTPGGNAQEMVAPVPETPERPTHTGRPTEDPRERRPHGDRANERAEKRGDNAEDAPGRDRGADSAERGGAGDGGGSGGASGDTAP